MPWAKVKPVYQPEVTELCYRPYEDHPHGCPNFNKKPGCPPKAVPIFQTLDPARSIWAVWNVFDLAGHVERLRAKHPDWSLRQLRCCLYWQRGARRDLALQCLELLAETGEALVIRACPEAQGVNVTETMKQIGIVLEWPPQTVTYQVALMGSLYVPDDWEL